MPEGDPDGSKINKWFENLKNLQSTNKVFRHLLFTNSKLLFIIRTYYGLLYSYKSLGIIYFMEYQLSNSAIEIPKDKALQDLLRKLKTKGSVFRLFLRHKRKQF